MVFKGYIPADIRASVFQLRQNTDMSIRQIAKVCGISPASATRVLKVGIQRRLLVVVVEVAGLKNYQRGKRGY